MVYTVHKRTSILWEALSNVIIMKRVWSFSAGVFLRSIPHMITVLCAVKTIRIDMSNSRFYASTPNSSRTSNSSRFGEDSAMEKIEESIDGGFDKVSDVVLKFASKVRANTLKFPLTMLTISWFSVFFSCVGLHESCCIS